MIEINNLTTEDIDEGAIKKLADIVLQGEGKESSSLAKKVHLFPLRLLDRAE
jgi:hypothetical protein